MLNGFFSLLWLSPRMCPISWSVTLFRSVSYGFKLRLLLQNSSASKCILPFVGGYAWAKMPPIPSKGWPSPWSPWKNPKTMSASPTSSLNSNVKSKGFSHSPKTADELNYHYWYYQLLHNANWHLFDGVRVKLSSNLQIKKCLVCFDGDLQFLIKLIVFNFVWIFVV